MWCAGPANGRSASFSACWVHRRSGSKWSTVAGSKWSVSTSCASAVRGKLRRKQRRRDADARGLVDG